MICACDEVTGLCGYHAEIVRKEVKYALNNAGVYGTAHSTQGESGNEADRTLPAPDISALVEAIEKWANDERLPLGLRTTKEFLLMAAKALRALEAENFKLAAGSCVHELTGDEYGHQECSKVLALQHQLAQRGEWLREALDKWEGWGTTVRMGSDWPDWERIATIRKALGEI